MGFLLIATVTSGAMPNSSRECAICHIRWVEALDRNQSRDLNMEAATERQAGSGDMCLSCHDGSVADSRFKVWSTRHHATDVKPSPAVRIPTDQFPLDAEGRMTCATCHTAHAVPGNSDLRTVIFLRQPNVDSSLCLACHPQHAQKSDFQHPLGPAKAPIPKAILEAGGRTSPDGHTILCQTCHEPHGAKNAWMLVLPPSELCIACHTGKMPEISPPAGAPVHRIGHTYTGFQPPATLLQERASFGPHGELSCLSCHRLHDASGAKPLLIRPNHDSSLCLECHEKEKTVLGSPHDLRVSSPDTANAHSEKPSTSGPCGACHRVHGWAREVPETNRPHSSGCMECHGPSGPGSRNRPYVEAHPVGVTPPEGKTVALPVDQATKTIGCLTCHDPHAGRPVKRAKDGRVRTAHQGTEEETMRGTHPTTTDFQFLRQEGSQLCVLCHDKMAHAIEGAHDPARFPSSLCQTLGVPPATGSCRVCHTAHNARGPHLWARAPGNSTNSPTSNLCTGCHDEKSVLKPQGTHHPLSGVRAQGSGVSPPAADTRPLIPDPSKEEVSCVSCHEVHETVRSAALLRRPADDLCTTCHQDKEQIRGSVHDPGAKAWGGPPNAKDRVWEPGKNLDFVSKGLCLDCHPLHGPTNQSALLKSLGGPRMPVETQNLASPSTQKSASLPCEACHRPGGPGTIVETPHVGQALPKQSGTGAAGRTFAPGDPNRASGLRLGRDNQVRCANCHDIHQKDPKLKLLRAPRHDGTLCLTCHAGFAGVLGSPHDLRQSAPLVPNVRGELVMESGPCGVCHVVHPAPGAAGTWAQRVPAGHHPGTALCTSCHSHGNCAQTHVPQRADHPEVALLNRIPPRHAESMPTFDQQGRPSPTGSISCPTCHQMHAASSGEASSWRSEVPSLPPANLALQTPRTLLRTTHQTLCADCHGMEAPWRFLYYHRPGRNPRRQPDGEAPPPEVGNRTGVTPGGS